MLGKSQKLQLLGKEHRSTLTPRKKQGQFVFSQLLQSSFCFVSNISDLPLSFLFSGGEGNLDFFKISKGSTADLVSLKVTPKVTLEPLKWHVSASTDKTEYALNKQEVADKKVKSLLLNWFYTCQSKILACQKMLKRQRLFCLRDFEKRP